MPNTKTSSSAAFDRWAMLLVLGVGAFMVRGALRYTVFDDEAFSCRRYVMPVGEMLTALWSGVEPDPPLYYLAQNAWVRVFGIGPLGLRGLSIALFLGGLLVLRKAAAAWFDEDTGRVALLLAAVHPAHLFLGFAARWYSAMFLAVGVLLLVTGRMVRRWDSTADRDGGRGVDGGDARAVDWRRALPWSVAAAAVCYTNYFGPVVVALVWLAALGRTRQRDGATRYWIVAGALALALFSVWLPSYVRELTRFPHIGGSPLAYAATGARTGLALLTGNLASFSAWWAWGPMAAFALVTSALLIRRRRTAWPMGVVVIGAFVAGTASLSMQDKYIMAFSGPACLLVAALFVAGRRAAPRSLDRRLATTAIGLLVLGWIGCGVNLTTERHWSSLRWLDPTEPALRQAQSIAAGDGPALIVMSHPAGRYYAACLAVADALGQTFGPRTHIDAGAWRDADRYDADGRPVRESGVVAPREALPLLEKRDDDNDTPRTLVTIETAAFANATDWAELRRLLDQSFNLIDEQRLLEDPDAALKDRLDPGFTHPSHRIVIRHWQPKKAAGD